MTLVLFHSFRGTASLCDFGHGTICSIIWTIISFHWAQVSPVSYYAHRYSHITWVGLLKKAKSWINLTCSRGPPSNTHFNFYPSKELCFPLHCDFDKNNMCWVESGSVGGWASRRSQNKVKQRCKQGYHRKLSFLYLIITIVHILPCMETLNSVRFWRTRAL